MPTTSRKRFPVLVVLLFSLLLAIIVGLTLLILRFRLEMPPVGEPAQPLPAIAGKPSGAGPVTEVLIRLDGEPPPADLDPSDPDLPAPPPTPPGVLFPRVCEAYDSQIRGRDAYPHPLTHEGRVAPTRVTVLLDIRPQAP